MSVSASDAGELSSNVHAELATDATLLAQLNEAVQRLTKKLTVPSSTYRLQLHSEFNLKDALGIVPYLQRLGVSHLYLSSLLTARPGSKHGYDVVNPSQLNSELGTEDDLEQLVHALHERNMGLLIDIVPNHMAVGEHNEWWMDVLANGRASRYAEYFDIAWTGHPRQRLHGKVLLPILSEPYGKVIQAGRVCPLYESGKFFIKIDETKLPLDPRTYVAFLEPALQSWSEVIDNEDEAILELQSIVTAVKHLPGRDAGAEPSTTETQSEVKVIQRRLTQLAVQHTEFIDHLNLAMNEIGCTGTDLKDWSSLTQLLDHQAYRPCFWRVALDEINYRRFFDVNDLAAVAEERLEVFLAVHEKSFEWLQKGWVDGFRIDHVDGLLNPRAYLDRLQRRALVLETLTYMQSDSIQNAEQNVSDLESKLTALAEQMELPPQPLIYVVVEKILATHERLPIDWRCHGTTGYEYLNKINGLFVDTQNAASMSQVYEQFIDQPIRFEASAFENKLLILRTTMASELHVLAHRLDALAQSQWWSQDFTLNGLRQALEMMIASFSVYRTYVDGEVHATDRAVVLKAARLARTKLPLLGREIFDFISDTLLLKAPSHANVPDNYEQLQLDFTGRFQQLTAPVMAKGVEDTTLYQYNRLASLNEVGGEPSKFGYTSNELHQFFARSAETTRGSLSPMSTHDTKRSDDVRANINVLSEIPTTWGECIRRWHSWNESHRTELDDGLIAPDANDEYFIYQTLVGAWTADAVIDGLDDPFVQRIHGYLTKAMREAKLYSSWLDPNEDYETATLKFVDAILLREHPSEFHDAFERVRELVQQAGRYNSLSQTLLHCTASAVPDTYQGTETCDYSLADPDNRRPVDYRQLEQMLDEIEQLDAPELNRSKLSQLNRAEQKLLVSSVALQLRRKMPDVFERGTYLPLETEGPDSRCVFGFLWTHDASAALIAVPRFLASTDNNGSILIHSPRELQVSLVLPDPWSQRVWTDVITSSTHEATSSLHASNLFKHFPVALLTSNEATQVSPLAPPRGEGRGRGA